MSLVSCTHEIPGRVREYTATVDWLLGHRDRSTLGVEWDEQFSAAAHTYEIQATRCIVDGVDTQRFLFATGNATDLWRHPEVLAVILLAAARVFPDNSLKDGTMGLVGVATPKVNAAIRELAGRLCGPEAALPAFVRQ
jgi:hypothetical protein